MRYHALYPRLMFFVALLFFGVFVWLDYQPAQTQSNLYQINQLTSTHQAPVSGHPTSFVELNGKTYFTLNPNSFSSAAAIRSGLWETDGTDEGTMLIRDVLIHPTSLRRVGDLLFFKSIFGELWRSDGTVTGTLLLTEDLDRYQNSPLVAVNDRVYFVDRTGARGPTLWRTDGTPDGTVPLFAATDTQPFTNPEQLTSLGGRLYFVANDLTDDESRLWTSDGTTAGTEIVSGAPGALTKVVSVQDQLFFTVGIDDTPRELWRYDAETTTATLVASFEPTSNDAFFGLLTSLNDHLLFTLNNGNGDVLWQSDGTEAGTQMIIDVYADHTRDYLVPVAVTDSYLYFKAYEHRESAGEIGLWRTDGTSTGTSLIGTYFGVDANGPVWYEDKSPQHFVVDGETLYFITDEEALWQSDGTVAGTVQISTPPVKRLGLGADGLYLSLFDETTGYELGYTDGTTAGTRLIKDVDPNHTSPEINQVVTANGRTYLVQSSIDSLQGQLWMSEGIGSPAVLLDEEYRSYRLEAAGDKLFVGGWGERDEDDDLLIVNPETNQLEVLGTFSTVNFQLSLNGQIYFTVYDRETEELALWTSDGTVDGTVQLIDGLRYQTTNVWPLGPQFYAFDDHLIVVHQKTIWHLNTTGTEIASFEVPELGNSGYSASVGEHVLYLRVENNQLVRTDGTEEGTIYLTDGELVDLRVLAINGDAIYLRIGNDLWYHDGMGTAVTQLTTGAMLYDVDFNYEVVDGIFYFTRTHEDYGSELWTSDGTVVGTEQVQTIVPLGVDSYPGPNLWSFQSTLLFSKNDEAVGWELWGSDGTAEGTGLLQDMFPGAESSRPSYVGETATNIFFRAFNDTYGEELWQSNGTAEGTGFLKDIYPGTGSSYPYRSYANESHIFFLADDNEHGRELWQSDGTTEGTRMVIDLYPGLGSSGISIYGWQDDILYFTGDNGRDGEQLFALSSITPRSLPPDEEPTLPAEQAHHIFLPHVNR